MAGRSVRRTTLTVLVALAILLGVGFATYYLNLNRKPKTIASRVRAAFEQPDRLRFAPTTLIDLRFSEKRNAASDERGVAHSLESVYASGDRIYVVDHPTWHVGARVRWYSSSGGLLGTHLAPSGSTLFAASPNGFAYVLAKSGSEGERVRLFDRNGAAEATFTVPLGANSGGLAFFDGQVYSRVQSGEASIANKTITVSYVYLPVTVDGRQAQDAEAEAGILEFWSKGDDGKLYRRVIATEGFGAQGVTTQLIERVADGARLELPAAAIPLGVDASGRLVVGLNPNDIGGTGRPLAGWPAAKEPYSEIAFISFDGKTWALNVINSLLPAFPVRYFDLDDDGYWSLVADADGVKVQHYQAVAQ